jgi:hypothetical protein
MLTTAKTCCFVAWPARINTAMQRPKHRTQAIDVFHNIDFADAGPIRVDTPERRTKHPEGRPIARCGCPADIGLLNGRLDIHHPTGRRLEIGTLSLDTPRSPCATAQNGLDDQMTAAILIHIIRAGGHALDFTRTPVASWTARIARSGVVQPIARIDARIGSAAKFITPLEYPILGVSLCQTARQVVCRCRNETEAEDEKHYRRE